MLGDPENQFSLTRTAPSTGGRAKSHFLSLAFLLLAGAGNAADLHDDFNGGSIDSSLWTTSLPFGTSALDVSAGRLDFVNRGTITTAGEFGAVDIQGRFTINGGANDMLKIVLRSDGSFTGPYAECANGLAVRIGQRGYDDGSPFSNNIEIEDRAGAPPLFDASYPVLLNTPYDFRIRDDGTTISIYISDLNNPLGSVMTSLDWGDKIVLYNREYQGEPSYVTALDFLDITTIPEPSNCCLLLVFGFLCLFVAYRRNHPRSAE